MKTSDFVKLQNVGIGKIEKSYDENLIVINVCGTQYYRYADTDLHEIEPSSGKEYIEFLKEMIKQLTEQSKTKRKQAADYNKQTNGEAVKRKGLVHYDNGFIIPVENFISKNHRELLSDAKKAKELKDKLKKEIAEYKEKEKWQKEYIKREEKALKEGLQNAASESEIEFFKTRLNELKKKAV